jgi:molybdopterin synthase catalytic subunit/molybdopterin converting factor small subunit
MGILLKMMQVQLLPFGSLKDALSALGFESTLELPEHATVSDLLAIVAGKAGEGSAAAKLLPRIAVSVNAEYSSRDQILNDADVVGLLPPVSGGSPGEDSARTVVTYLTHDSISTHSLIESAKQASDGAIVVFDGIVRNETRGRQTLHLDYEAYEEMASKQLDQLADQAIHKFPVRAVTIVHRLGRLSVGETSILIIVASAHRVAAYDASRWLIDTLKKTVPIWKKETFVDGAVWADGEEFPIDLIALSGSTAEQMS